MSRVFYQSKRLFQYWWVSLVIGLLSIIAGICCFVTPVDSLAIMTEFFMALLVIGGLLNIVFAFANRKWNGFWGWSLARGIIEILFGLWLFILPLPLVTTTLIYIVGFWMLFHSILGICESCELSLIPMNGWGWLLACNIVSLLCSFVFLVSPVFGGIFVLVYIGMSFLFYGLFRIVLSLRWRKFNKKADNEDADIVM